MANFSFKQFTIKQDACAMKVSLDACLLGALCNVEGSQQILDIGAGTGLLSLMLAQRINDDCHIDAIEIDDAAFTQAQDNIQASPFSTSISLHHSAIQKFKAQQKYNCIICNPPFFSQQLKGPDAQRNLARHNESLSFTDLCKAIKINLSADGLAWMLLPINELERFSAAMTQQSLTCKDLWQVVSRRNKPPKVCIFTLQHTREDAPKALEPANEHKLYVYDENNQYTGQFRGLLADYYLKL